MLTGKTTKFDKDSLVKKIAEALDIYPATLLNGGTVPSSFMNDVASKLGHTGGSNTYRVFEEVLSGLGQTYEPNLDSSEHSDTGGGTITNHGYRKLLRSISKMKFAFILNYNDHEISSKYGDSHGQSYSFNDSVNGRKGLMDAGKDSLVIFYKTSKSSSTPNRCFTGWATIDEIHRDGPENTTLVFRDFVTFTEPIPVEDVQINGWNVQNSVAEIEETLLKEIIEYDEARSNTSSLDTKDLIDELAYGDVEDNFEVEIRPEADSLKIYSGLTNTPHYAIGEFIDNSISSAMQNIEVLRSLHGAEYQLQVEVVVDKNENQLVIIDNAAGIPRSEIQSAIKTGRKKADKRIGLGVYGVGMKASAFWFGTQLKIQTFPAQESVGWEVIIDISGSDEVENLTQVKKINKALMSGTIITVSNLRDGITKPSAMNKTKGFLASIYRDYVGTHTHQGVELDCKIIFNRDSLKYTTPPLLESAFWPSQDGPIPNGEVKVWRQEVAIELSSGKEIRGWVGILKGMSRFSSGLTLFYNQKAITGAGLSGDYENTGGDSSSGKFKPAKIFGQAGSKLDQSFIGEFDVTALGKTITTDKPNWSDDEQEEFVTELLALMKEGEQNIHEMAKNFKRRPGTRPKPTDTEIKELDKKDAEAIERNMSGDLDHSSVAVVEDVVAPEKDDVDGLPGSISLNDKQGHTHSFFITMIRKRNAPFVMISDSESNEHSHTIYVNLDHPLLDDLEETDLNVRTLVRKISVAIASTKIFVDSPDSGLFVNRLNAHFDLMAGKNTEANEGE